jgi:hypothetical protein
MEHNRTYQPLSGDEDGDMEEKGIDWNASTEIIPTHTRVFGVCMSVFLLSLSINVLLVLDNAHLRNASRDWGKTKYSESTSLDSYRHANSRQAELRSILSLHTDHSRSSGIPTSVTARLILPGMR